MSTAEMLIARGEARGVLKGKLQMLQKFMRLPVASDDDLKGFDLAELQRRYEELELRYADEFRKP